MSKNKEYKYYEKTIISEKYPIVLDIWEGNKDKPAIIFLPGTMAYPNRYIDFLESIANMRI